MNPSNDMDRALTSISSRADHLRYTISRLEHNLAWNPTMTWPELLGQYMVIGKQLENINDEIPDMIQHFVCVPYECTENFMQIPLMLRTRDDPKAEEEEEKVYENSKQKGKEFELIKKEIDLHNEFTEKLEESYKEMLEALTRDMKSVKYKVNDDKKATKLDQMFQYLETQRS